MALEEYPAGKIEVRGQQIEVCVDDRGDWVANVDGVRYRAATREALWTRLMRVLRAKTARVRVPFSLAVRVTGGMAVRHGVATGLHAKTGKVLIRWSDGQTEQSHLLDALTPLSAEESERYAQALAARRDAERAVREFEQAHRMNVAHEVKAAIDAELAKGE